MGLTSYNIKLHVPSDIAIHNQYIPQQNLKSQKWLGEPSKHEMSQIVEKVHKGGGQSQNQNSLHFKCRLL